MKAHPSKDIVGTKGDELKGKRVVLCVTGSVAAVRCVDVARELMRHGAEVFVVMSQMAQKIVHPYLLEWATGNPVVTELTGKVEHVAFVSEYANKADLVLVAPATANTISKIACGIDDTPVTSVVSAAIGAGLPIVIVPATHESMYRHPIVTENLRKLQAIDVEIVGPRVEEGKAKIAEAKEIVEAVIRRLTIQRDLLGLRVLITAGPTVEYIDPIRVITNKSSGKMGVSIAEEALRRGADVTLVYGLGRAPPPQRAKVLSVETTERMYEAVVSELKSTRYDVVIAAAAAADWTPEEPYVYKVPTRELPLLTLKLKPAPKVVKAVKEVSPEVFLVAFRAEYNLSNEELIESAHKLLLEVGADLVVANDVGRKGVGFGTDTNEVFIVDKMKNVIHIPLTLKRDVARKLIDVIVEMLKTRKVKA